VLKGTLSHKLLGIGNVLHANLNNSKTLKLRFCRHNQAKYINMHIKLQKIFKPRLF